MRTLLAPDVTRGHGTGHLRRCIKLMNHLESSFLLLPEHSDNARRGCDELAGLLTGVPAGRIVHESVADADMVVIDAFSATCDEVRAFGRAVTVGVDLGGAGRELCSFVVDTLPGLDLSPSNVTNHDYVDLPDAIPLETDRHRTVLVTFGGEDPARLTESTVETLIRNAGIAPEAVTVVRPGLRVPGELPDGITVLEPVPSLYPLYSHYETVICSYGLTALEARAAGRSVITVAPTRYHDLLARSSGFVTAGVGKPSARALGRLAGSGSDCSGPVPVDAAQATLASRPGKGPAGLAALLCSLSPLHTGCPAHPDERGQAVWRLPDRSYFCCPVCGLVYMERLEGEERSYTESYFDTEYRAQYGRTYLEDFEHIRQMGKRRLETVLTVNRAVRTALDLGCAYGPFLKAVQDAGLQPFGVDIAPEAVTWVTENLHVPAACASLLEFDPAREFAQSSFDIVSLWYVIEHFAELDRLLPRLSEWVNPGGVLALATPNVAGVSGRRSPERFYRESPTDHHTAWHPAAARRLLDEHGFAVRRIVSTGHHPERYPVVKRGLLPKGIAGLHSRAFGWGDTFEIYAQRVGHE